jgi:hypothetical protein
MTNLEKLIDDIKNRIPKKHPHQELSLYDLLAWSGNIGHPIAISNGRLLIWDNDMDEYYLSIYRINIHSPGLMDQPEETLTYLAS